MTIADLADRWHSVAIAAVQAVLGQPELDPWADIDPTAYEPSRDPWAGLAPGGDT